MHSRSLTLNLLVLALLSCQTLFAQGNSQRGPGRQRGRDERHRADHEVFHYLLTHHKQITREVKNLPNGVETLTQSTSPEIAAKIKEHVQWMKYRVDESNPIRMRDPLFAELFRHASEIEMQFVETPNGVRVIETSDNPKVARLIQAHAEVVSGFVEHGFVEAAKNHDVPKVAEGSSDLYHNPLIKEYGKVVSLPKAQQQPRAGSKIVVDITKGSDADQLNPAIEKIARYVNIYAGAGQAPATVDIAVVLHGDATLSVLNSEAYARKYDVKENPNLKCINQLRQAGVTFYVCGQSLIGKGNQPDDVSQHCQVAVSALTALVNLQSDGFAYIPMLK